MNPNGVNTWRERLNTSWVFIIYNTMAFLCFHFSRSGEFPRLRVRFWGVQPTIPRKFTLNHFALISQLWQPEPNLRLSIQYPKKKEKTICTWKYNLSEIGKSSSSIRLSKMDECKQLTTLGSGMTRSSSLCETMIQEVWTTLTEKYENQWLNQGFVQHIMVIMVIIIIFCHHDHLHVPSQFHTQQCWYFLQIIHVSHHQAMSGHVTAVLRHHPKLSTPKYSQSPRWRFYEW